MGRGEPGCPLVAMQFLPCSDSLGTLPFHSLLPHFCWYCLVMRKSVPERALVYCSLVSSSWTQLIPILSLKYEGALLACLCPLQSTCHLKGYSRLPSAPSAMPMPHRCFWSVTLISPHFRLLCPCWGLDLPGFLLFPLAGLLSLAPLCWTFLLDPWPCFLPLLGHWAFVFSEFRAPHSFLQVQTLTPLASISLNFELWPLARLTPVPSSSSSPCRLTAVNRPGTPLWPSHLPL